MTDTPGFCAKSAEALCARLAKGESLGFICADDEMPALANVFVWLGESEAFRVQYDHACLLRQSAIEQDLGRFAGLAAEITTPSRLPDVLAMWLRARMPTCDPEEEVRDQITEIRLVAVPVSADIDSDPALGD